MADGKFFLGKEVTGPGNELGDNYLYKADDLNTHCMVLGMTGSGKTGLCLDLVEEAIGEDVPLIIIDPKGDLTNLDLMFPDFSPADFQPWVSPGEAERKGIPQEQYAKETAEKWKMGLHSWGLSPQDVRDIKDKADIRIFTPGSSAGMRISILEGFKKPDMDFLDDEEAMVERIQNTVSALLALLDVDNDPLKSKPHILISNIIEHYWRMGRSVSIEELIINLQKPPIRKLGVFDIDQLIDEKERSELAFKINNIIASPGFRFWTSGMPLSAGQLYKKENGRVPVNIFYIAHLSDSERMFFVTLLLNEIVYWMRTQSGSGKLKNLLYMDEIFGYLPPYPQNPPSKTPLLLLLKQARAFGLGLVLATQNPKDIDYKGLTNMGTWFVGKLQAEGDRERVMEGLTGLTDESGQPIKDSEIKQMMASLANRRFLVKNVHQRGVKTFQTRWAMSYLAGPLSRQQLKTLTREQKKKQLTQPATPPSARPSLIREPQTAPAFTPARAARRESRPHLLSYVPRSGVSMDDFFLNGDGAGKYYSPLLYMDGDIIFDDNRLGLYIRRKFFLAAPLEESPNWRDATLNEEPIEYDDEPLEETQGFEPIDVKLNYTTLRRMQTSFKNFLFSNLSLDVFVNKDLNLSSETDETREAFEQRCRDVVERMIDRDVDKLKDSYERKIARLEDRLEREQLSLKRLERERKSKQMEEYLSVGESVLGMFLGSKSRRGLSSAARKRRSTRSAAGRVEMKQSKMEQLQEEILALQQDLEDKVADIEDVFYEKAGRIEPLEIRLEKNDIIISQQAILWKLI